MLAQLRFFSLFIACIFSSSAMAHSPSVSSTLLVEEMPGQWVLQIRSALTAFEYEVEHVFGTSAYATPDEFMDLVIEHVASNILIEVNDSNVNLVNGSVNLGHETSVTFNVEGMPDDLSIIQVTNQSFKDIHRNQSALIILKKDTNKDQYKLENDNDHTVILKLHNGQFQLKEKAIEKVEMKVDYSLLVMTLVAFVVIIFIGAIRLRKA